MKSIKFLLIAMVAMFTFNVEASQQNDAQYVTTIIEELIHDDDSSVMIQKNKRNKTYTFTIKSDQTDQVNELQAISQNSKHNSSGKYTIILNEDDFIQTKDIRRVTNLSHYYYAGIANLMLVLKILAAMCAGAYIWKNVKQNKKE